MTSFGIRKDLLSARDRTTLASLNAELSPTGIKFRRHLMFDEMRIIGQIIVDLKIRTNDEDNHINFALGDWMNQADEWFGPDVGIRMGVLTKPTKSYSCFVCYSHKDEDFAKQLYSRLRSANIKAFYAPEDVKGGEKLHEQIDQAIQTHDKLLIILSENSLDSDWVMTEIRKARKAEIEHDQRKLFPIRLVNMEFLQDWECFDADTGKDLAVEVREYFIPDFSNWRDRDAFQLGFGKLLDDLKAKELIAK